MEPMYLDEITTWFLSVMHFFLGSWRWLASNFPQADANTSDDAGTTCFHFAADLGHARVALLTWISGLPTCSQQEHLGVSKK